MAVALPRFPCAEGERCPYAELGGCSHCVDLRENPWKLSVPGYCGLGSDEARLAFLELQQRKRARYDVDEEDEDKSQAAKRRKLPFAHTTPTATPVDAEPIAACGATHHDGGDKAVAAGGGTADAWSHSISDALEILD